MILSGRFQVVLTNDIHEYVENKCGSQPIIVSFFQELRTPCILISKKSHTEVALCRGYFEMHENSKVQSKVVKILLGPSSSDNSWRNKFAAQYFWLHDLLLKLRKLFKITRSPAKFRTCDRTWEVPADVSLQTYLSSSPREVEWAPS